MEEWRAIPGFEGKYEVSDQGRVRSLRTGRARLLSVCHDGRGYPAVALFRKRIRVHTLVAATFLGPRAEGQVTRHLDGEKSNNEAANLAYGTQADNAADAVRHGSHERARRRDARPDLATRLLVRREVESGKTQSEVAKLFGVCQPHVSRIIRGCYALDR